MEVCKTMIQRFGKHCDSVHGTCFMIINRVIGKLLHVYVQYTVAVFKPRLVKKLVIALNLTAISLTQNQNHDRYTHIEQENNKH